MSKRAYFGTDGIRGQANKHPMTAEVALRVGLAAGKLFMSQDDRRHIWDQDEVLACLKKQGGLDKCVLSFYEDEDIGDDKVWDNWRIEGPSFVWYFRGAPHVHVWVNIAASA